MSPALSPRQAMVLGLGAVAGVPYGVLGLTVGLRQGPWVGALAGALAVAPLVWKRGSSPLAMARLRERIAWVGAVGTSAVGVLFSVAWQDAFFGACMAGLVGTAVVYALMARSEVLVLRAEHAAGVGDAAAARRGARQVLSRRLVSPTMRYRAAWLAVFDDLAQGNVDGAAQVFAHLAPGTWPPDLYVLLAFVCAVQGRYGDADGAMARATSARPGQGARARLRAVRLLVLLRTEGSDSARAWHAARPEGPSSALEDALGAWLQWQEGELRAWVWTPELVARLEEGRIWRNLPELVALHDAEDDA